MGEHGETRPLTFTDRARTWASGITSAAGRVMVRLGVHPDTITLIGLGVVALGALCIGMGWLQIGGLVLLVSLPLDALDGATARARGQMTAFGGVLDSALDRYADGLIFGGLIVYHMTLGDQGSVLLALAALTGSFAVSYVRARAGEAGLEVKIGWFSRLERVIVLLLMLLIPPLLPIGLWVLAIGTNVTAVQRLWYARRHLS
jgi:CDP-diacylglycerol--glycerol-3-phosphate 3-phosphatidyltransferase